MPTHSAADPDTARVVWRLMFGVLMQTNPQRQASLAKRGLTPNDSRALHSLDREHGRRLGVLARVWQCDPSTATWVVDRLERAGLAERRASPTDRRVKLVTLTEQGQATMNDLLAEFHQPPAILSRLSNAELATLKTLLEKLGAAPAPDGALE